MVARRRDSECRLPNADVELLWERGIFPRVVVVEGRRSTVGRLAEVDRGRYTLHLSTNYRARATGQVPAYYLYHSVFVRKGAWP